jgi:Asp-tRNA(Asn)/Glu-tRNA(Gln) amidotransferase A subunit family amidase
MSFAFSLVDLPSLSLPVGYTADGLPVGLQLVGRPGGDAALLAAAAAYERAHDWSRAVPRNPGTLA